jgi:DNA gyrase subunit A
MEYALLLIDGQGNLGLWMEIVLQRCVIQKQNTQDFRRNLADIDKETVDFKLNFDDTLEEPTVMPTRVPTLLINGATGIAGMATNMPHNLTEVINGTLAYMDNNDIEIDELINLYKSPDFPTGGIYGYEGVREAFKTGRGRVVMRQLVLRKWKGVSLSPKFHTKSIRQT